ncbi:MAG: radical SAM protein [Chloroflexi bacterium]|nr:radical SAM protein [Chloroflexota bacterium]
MPIPFSTLAANAAVKFNQAAHQTFALPLLIFFPTARCNSRCVSCDWWQADGKSDLTLDEIRALTAQLPELRTRLVLFSGGEPLLRREVFEIADLFRAQGVTLHLLTSGLFLDKYPDSIAARFEQVTISLDAHTPTLYHSIRGVDALALVERGVTRLRDCAPTLPIRARSTLHRYNFGELPRLIDKAHAMGLAQISFLAADVTSEAFGRRVESSTRGLLLKESEVKEFEQVVEETIRTHARDFETRFVAESPEKLRRLPRYYAAQLGLGPFPTIACNAPWMSAVVEADGAVRPCFFHHAVGNIRDKGLGEILRMEMVEFRRGLHVAENETCRKCVCTMQVGWRSRVWQ